MDWHVRILVFIMWERYISCIFIIFSSVTVCAGVLFSASAERKPAPGASVTPVNHSVHILSTLLRIRADPSMQIFWVSVRVALPDTFLMFSTIPLLLLLLLLLFLLLFIIIIIIVQKQVKNNADKIERRFGVILTPFSSSKWLLINCQKHFGWWLAYHIRELSARYC